MGDLFDNEVNEAWRLDHMRIMQECYHLEWQICTKRVSNVAKMVPDAWKPLETSNFGNFSGWPRHIGVLVTIVTQAEADRDVPRLLKLKKQFDIPWVGISYEPAQERIRFDRYLGERGRAEYGASLDWIIFGGKSGAQWNDRPFDIDWGYDVANQCAVTQTAFFMKQIAAFQPKEHMIPEDLRIRQWPQGH
mgnify:CR=1 FL=1